MMMLKLSSTAFLSPFIGHYSAAQAIDLFDGAMILFIYASFSSIHLVFSVTNFKTFTR